MNLVSPKRPKITINVWQQPENRFTVAWKFRYKGKWYGQVFQPNDTPVQNAINMMLDQAMNSMDLVITAEAVNGQPV